MACALQCRDQLDLGDEVRRLINIRCNMPIIVDSAQGDYEICTIFSNKYNDFITVYLTIVKI